MSDVRIHAVSLNMKSIFQRDFIKQAVICFCAAIATTERLYESGVWRVESEAVPFAQKWIFINKWILRVKWDRINSTLHSQLSTLF